MLLFRLEYKRSVNTQKVIARRDMPHIRFSFTPMWNFWNLLHIDIAPVRRTLSGNLHPEHWTMIFASINIHVYWYWVSLWNEITGSDEHLNFSRHNGEVCKNTSRKVGVLMRLRNMLTLSAKLKIFISFIMPQITYCHTVWHFCRASDSRKMKRAQERALRAVYCDTRSSYDELSRKAKLTTLGCRRLQDIAIISYKAKYNICPPYKKDIFILISWSW